MARQVNERIRSDGDYEKALDEIERYFEREPAPGTPAAARFDALAQMIEEYEARHWPIEQARMVEDGRSAIYQEGKKRVVVGAKRDYHVVPNKDRGGWDVRRDGADRSSGHFERKSDAMDRGRELAREHKTELVEHGRNGRIQDSDSSGNDPLPPRVRKH